MKQTILGLLKDSLSTVLKSSDISEDSILNKVHIDRTKDKSHGDFATNVAMLLSKPLKQNPRAIAEMIVNNLKENNNISKVEIAGPGFINFFVNTKSLEQALNSMHQDERLMVKKDSVPKTVVVDYSAPNVAKEMAVHHIRSTVIGDAVVKVLEFLGHNVIRANHIGDWGTQFGMLIAYLEKVENESGQGMELSDFEAFYRAAKEKYDSDEAFAVKARNYVVQLQGGDEYCHKMWRKLVDMTTEQNQKLYDRLDVSLTKKDIMGESMYNDMLPLVVDDLLKKGIATTDQGAVVVYLPQFKNKEGEPLGNIIRKSDGGYLYTTTDIACVKYRIETLHADRILYFTDSRQQQHLETVWAICNKAGYVPDNISLEHCPFGMMLGKDGKPFKTRSGGTVKLKDLLDESEKKVTELLKARDSKLEGEERDSVIHNIAIGAVKYADLSKNRTTDYVFDWEQMLSFDGNTAPYLQYAYSRIQAIFRKAQNEPLGPITITNDTEEDLGNKLLAFSDAVYSVASKSMPNYLCNYLFELSNLFMHFYEACPVLKEGVDEKTRQSRLTLCDLTAKVLKQGLGLLGISVMEQM
jgi:arginyl-tRNA synthetase